MSLDPAAAMPVPAWSEVEVGDTLPPLQMPPVDRTMLALYAGASNDHNPIHIDIDAARKAGMDDVIAHGMLSVAWLGRLLTQWVDQRRLREFGVRFAGITHVGESITCSGRVVEKFVAAGESRIRLEVRAVNQLGDTRLAGHAVVAL